MGAMGIHYRAFISYSHADAAQARWLHQRLEAYRLPGEAVALSQAAGRADRLGPIFLDREELAATADLSAAVTQALASSDVLVVLCSPDAVASPWVTREIELFRTIGPDRPILAAVVCGDPATVIPQAISSQREPLAADLRPEGDGRRLGFLKIAAGIAGVPLGSLVQRDAQRKLRRVTAITLVTACLAIIMAIMSVIAIKSRNEAERQRREAVALASYMGNDLREKLRGVGRLDLMADVNDRALAYCRGQGELAALPVDAVLGCVQIYHGIVEIETTLDQGDLAAAEANAQVAYRATERLLARAPGDANVIYAHGQSQYWVGRVCEVREDYAAAAHWFAAYDASARQLQQHEPNSSRSLMELGFGALNRGIVAFRGDLADADAASLFEQAIGWFGRAAQRQPRADKPQQELANAWSWLSNLRYNNGDYAAALAAQRQAAGIRRRLADADPQDRAKLFDRLIAERALALAQLRLGNVAAAGTQLRQTAAQAGDLAASDPANKDWQYLAELALADVEQLN